MIVTLSKFSCTLLWRKFICNGFRILVLFIFYDDDNKKPLKTDKILFDTPFAGFNSDNVLKIVFLHHLPHLLCSVIQLWYDLRTTRGTGHDPKNHNNRNNTTHDTKTRYKRGILPRNTGGNTNKGAYRLLGKK